MAAGKSWKAAARAVPNERPVDWIEAPLKNGFVADVRATDAPVKARDAKDAAVTVATATAARVAPRARRWHGGGLMAKDETLTKHFRDRKSVV